MIYNWQQSDWPTFRYDVSAVEDMLFEFAELTGHVSGMLKALPEAVRLEAVIDMMAAEAIKTSEIEGVYLSRQDVVSPIRNHLSLNPTSEATRDKMAQGAGELMVDARKTYADAITAEKLFQWHTMLLREQKQINIGVWRSHEEPIQFASGALGKEKVHFVAPPSSRIPDEMSRFIQWFNDTSPGGGREIRKAPVRSAMTHLYFETLHPFEDGNGRIGRALAEKALSQTLSRPVLLSLSRTIEADKKAYYYVLEQAQKSNDITSWGIYFVRVVLKSQQEAISLVDFILKKSKFFDRFKNSLNERQLKAVRRMLEAGPEGFGSAVINALKT